MSSTNGRVQDPVAAAEAEPGFPTAYAARVRAAVRRLDPLPDAPMDVRQMLGMATHKARIDVDVPLRGQSRAAKAAKVAIRRATAWYLRYLADQMGDLGQALVQLGTALADRVDAVAGEVDGMSGRVDGVADRVAEVVVTVEALAGDLGEARLATEAALAELRRRVAAVEAGLADRRARPVTAEGGARPQGAPAAAEAPQPEPAPERKTDV